MWGKVGNTIFPILYFIIVINKGKENVKKNQKKEKTIKKILKSCMITILIILCFSCRKNINKENIYIENNQEVFNVDIEDDEEIIVNNGEGYPIEKKDIMVLFVIQILLIIMLM
jgi:hypothetical protein